jgi:hypothetical protein
MTYVNQHAVKVGIKCVVGPSAVTKNQAIGANQEAGDENARLTHFRLMTRVSKQTIISNFHA